MSGGASMSPAQAVGAAIRRNGHLIADATNLTPFDEMARREEEQFDDGERRIREEGISTWIEWLFEGGIHEPADLGRVCKRLVSYARLYRPDLLCNMSMDQVGALFGQGRAAVQAREKNVFEGQLHKAGYRTTQLPGGKSPRSRAKMAASAKGNQSRARSTKKSPL